MASIAWQLVGSVLLVRENDSTPTQHEWDGFLATIAQIRSQASTVRVLIMTDGGGPDHRQREQLKQRLGGRTVRSAVVTDSIKARFIASAIMLINKGHGSFTKRELEQAFDHLKLTKDERNAVARTIPSLRVSLKPLAS